MKNYLKVLMLVTLIFSLCFMNVNAATKTKSIDKSACETVYTNFYFFLAANTEDYFNQSALSKISDSNRAEFNNNSYQVNFDKQNIGYGLVEINTGTSTNGIKSMSLNDYYKIYLKAQQYNGAYTDGNVNYIVTHDWYKMKGDNWVETEGGLDLSDYSRSSLVAASINAKSTIKQVSTVKYSKQNPFVLQIDRDYYGYLTGTPIAYGNYNWYLHPAVYYIQYCEEKEELEEYVIKYYGNAEDATNVPDNDKYMEDECTEISTKKPKRNGYTFLGWSTDKNASKPDSDYAPGTEYCDGDLKLYAIWQKNAVATKTYEIVYKKNTTATVTNMPDSIIIEANRDVKISSLTPIREGYAFLGWSTDKNATKENPDYDGGSLYTDREDLTLYAIWKKNPENIGNYIIKYEKNTDDYVTNMPENLTISADKDVEISTLTPIRHEYKFLGWSTDATATVADSNYKGGTVYTERKDLILYAIWEKKPNIVPENPKTGIEDYMLPFGGAIASAMAILTVLKKKKSFRQF